jgi:hypothetical protein
MAQFNTGGKCGGTSFWIFRRHETRHFKGGQIRRGVSEIAKRQQNPVLMGIV